MRPTLAAGFPDLQARYAYKFSEPYLAGNGASVTAIYPLTSQNRYRVQGQTGTAYSINTAWAQAGASLLGNDRLQAAYSYLGADSVIYPYLLMTPSTTTHSAATRATR